MIPTATYRLQFHKDFTFADAAVLADYFAQLGISHIYASPILTARKGSMHGYDVIDHAHINPELGGEDGFRAMAAALHAKGIGIIVDIVPNHMAVGKGDNAWWLDVLARGLDSPYARAFDIDWDAPGLEGKVLAPFLGKDPAQALDDGELALVRDETGLAFAYYEHRFPLRPQDQDLVPQKLNRQQLRQLLERQHYVLADWREADRRINWRRFFDITDLAAIRIAEPEIFEQVHAKIFELYAEGLIDGVRVDHVDGIADPRAYCRKLRARLEALRHGAYLVIEKILAEGESLPHDWNVDGTTGYDFLNEVCALLHGDDAGALTAQWQSRSAHSLDFDAEEILARSEILHAKFAAQLDSTARAFAPLLGCSLPQASTCLAAILVRLRCYRPYATGHVDSPGGGDFLHRAIGQAREALPDQDAILARVEALFARHDDDTAVADAVRRFSQLSAPVAAKSVEDTAFYRYGRLLSRNDVGCNSGRARLTVADFHARMTARAADWPRAMLTTATHDHKRGEDARMRLAALSHDVPSWKTLVDEIMCGAPDDLAQGDIYQLLQTLYSAWPARPDQDFIARIQGWGEKFLREGKLRSSWAAPDQAYEKRFGAFAEHLINTKAHAFERLLSANLSWSQAASLVQLVLRNTLPGIPDLYQGNEFDDLSLVDPDNRRPVDFSARRSALHDLNDPKMTVLSRLLQQRRAQPDLFLRGDYQAMPLPAAGMIAFTRNFGQHKLVVVARLTPGPGEGEIVLDRGATDVCTGRRFEAGTASISALLSDYPAAVLTLAG